MAEHGHVHPISYYVKIWGGLLVLLIISVIGPELGIPIVTLITAFGIAVVKAFIVMKYFMHLDTESKMVWYILAGSVVLMGQYFFGVSADVMMHEGTRWENVAAKAEIERGLAAGDGHHGDGHGGGHGEAHGDDHGEAHGDDKEAAHPAPAGGH
jgi:caa(3)-type oxidase subunit IV